MPIKLYRPSRDYLLNIGLFIVSSVPLLLVIYVLIQRSALPMALEWGEGAGVLQIQRILENKPLYLRPSFDFAPLVYTPLYYYVAAGVAKVVGSLIFGGRMVSIISSLLAGSAIGWLVQKETGDSLASWYAAALYMACFSLCDGFYDLVRVDSFFILLCLITFYVLRSAKNGFVSAIAGLLAAATFFTKQSAVMVFLPLGSYLLLYRWKRYWPFGLTVGLAISIPLILLNIKTQGWFNYYAFSLPSEHGYSLLASLGFWVNDLFKQLGIVLGFGLGFFLIIGRDDDDGEMLFFSKSNTGCIDRMRRKETINNGQTRLCYGLFTIGALLASWITRSTNGGGANNAMPAYMAAALLFGLGYHQIMSRLEGINNHRIRYKCFVGGLITIQFLGLTFNPFNLIPTNEEILADQALVDEIRKLEEPVLIPYRSQLPGRAGKPTYIHSVGLFELTGYFLGDVQPTGLEIVKYVQEQICGQEYSLVILDQPIPWFQSQLDAAYELMSQDFLADDAQRSEVLEWQGGYKRIYMPKDVIDQDTCFESIRNNKGEGN